MAHILLLVSTLAIGLSIIPFYYLSWAVYNVLFHPLRKYPGPWYSSCSHLWWAYHGWIGDLVMATTKLHEKYGEVVRISPDGLSYINSQAWTDIYAFKTANGGNNLPRYDSIRRKDGNGVSSLVTANDEDHRRGRRLLAHAFSEKALVAQEPIFKEHIDKLISNLLQKASFPDPSSQVVDVVKWYNYATFDILGDLAFGASFGCLDTDALHPWISLIYGSVKDGWFTRICNTFSPPFSRLLFYLKPDSGMMAHIAQFRFSSDRAKERMALGATDRADFMSYILRHNDEKGMSVAEIESNAALLVVAGSETTATFLSGITYNLLRTPDVLAKLTKEIRDAFETQDDITIVKLTQMEYLSACVEEGFRTYPPVPNGGQARRTTKGGNVICGQYVPEETTVGVLGWAAFSSPKNFKDPERFVPERWLRDEKGEYSACGGRYRDDDRKAMQPFSIGPRNCLGKNLAYAELRLILVRMLWSFDLELQGANENWRDQKIYNFWEKKPLYVRLSPRKP